LSAVGAAIGLKRGVPSCREVRGRAEMTMLDTDGMAMPRDSEIDYLRRVEQLAHAVVDEAADPSEAWLSLLPDAAEATPLQRAVNDLARNLRMRHFDGDGCIDH